MRQFLERDESVDRLQRRGEKSALGSLCFSRTRHLDINRRCPQCAEPWCGLRQSPFWVEEVEDTRNVFPEVREDLAGTTGLQCEDL